MPDVEDRRLSTGPTCQYHREEVLERRNQRDDITALKASMHNIEGELAEVNITIALMNKDLVFIKKPLSVLALAVVVYMTQAVLKIAPYMTSVTGGK